MDQSDATEPKAVPGTDSVRHGGRDPLLARVAVAYLLMAAVLLFVVVASTGPGDALPGSEGIGWIQGWARWDSGWYYAIAEHGYTYSTDTQSSVAFFPTYPLLLVVGSVLFPVYVAGYLITLLSGLASCLLYARWCLDRMPRVPTMFAVAVLMLYPYSYYLYGAVYADALFLASAIAAFTLLDRGHPLLAGLVGIAATAGRPVGFAVLAGLAVRTVELAAQRSSVGESVSERDSGNRTTTGWTSARATARELTGRDASVLLAGAGLVGWCLYQWLRFDNPLAFVAAQSGWDQGSGLDVWIKAAFFRDLTAMSPQAILKLAVPGVALLGAIALLPRVKRRFGWGYLTYAAVVLGLPLLGTKDFLGVGRYLFAAFPVVAVAGELVAGLRPTWLRPALLLASAAGLLAGAAAYGAGLLIA